MRNTANFNTTQSTVNLTFTVPSYEGVNISAQHFIEKWPGFVLSLMTVTRMQLGSTTAYYEVTMILEEVKSNERNNVRTKRTLG